MHPMLKSLPVKNSTGSQYLIFMHTIAMHYLNKLCVVKQMGSGAYYNHFLTHYFSIFIFYFPSRAQKKNPNFRKGIFIPRNPVQNEFGKKEY